MSVRQRLKVFAYHNRLTRALFIIPFYFLRQLYNVVRYGGSERPQYFRFPGLKLVYLVNSKVAQTSITNIPVISGKRNKSMRADLVAGKSYTLESDIGKDFLFTFVRNPFDRLYSCYSGKYHTPRGRGTEQYREWDYYLFGYLSRDRGFEEFVRRVCKISDAWSDRHFVSQFFMIEKQSRQSMDFVGRYENLATDLAVLREKFPLGDMPHLNPSQKAGWQNAYTSDMVEMVYERYRMDFERWYSKAYCEMQVHLKETGDK